MGTLMITGDIETIREIDLHNIPPWAWKDVIESELSYSHMSLGTKTAFLEYNGYPVLSTLEWESSDNACALLHYLRCICQDTQNTSLLTDWIHYLSMGSGAIGWLHAWEEDNPHELASALASLSPKVYLDLFNQCNSDTQWNTLWELIEPYHPEDDIAFLIEFLLEYPKENPCSDHPNARRFMLQLPMFQSLLDESLASNAYDERRLAYQKIAALFIASTLPVMAIDFSWDLKK